MAIEFKAIIQQHEGKDAAYVTPPFDIQEVFGAKRVKVKASFDGEPYRGSIVTMSGCVMLGMTKEIRSKIGKGFGDEVFVVIEKDEEERTVVLPEAVLEAFKAEPALKSAFEAFSYSHQREYSLWLESAKREETKRERIAKMLSNLGEGKKLRE